MTTPGSGSAKLATSAQVPLVGPRALDRDVVIELMANARDSIVRDFVRGSALAVIAGLGAFALSGDPAVGAMTTGVVALPSLHIVLYSAIWRRRARCQELGVDPKEVDRLFKGVDLFKYVIGWNGLSPEVREALVEGILAERYLTRPGRGTP